MQLSAQHIQQATSGIWHHGQPSMIEHISTDSRHFSDGACFLALRGPHFDGHTYASQISGKAQALIGDTQGAKAWQDLALPQLLVNDTLQALGDIAHAWRTQLQHTSIIAITGSYGKTSVRDLLKHVFEKLGLQVHATAANLNNLIGVPQTIMAIESHTDIALIECGISETGEMARLATIVAPDIAIITGITTAHGEGLGGEAGVIREKLHLLDTLSENGWFALGEGVGEKTPTHIAENDCPTHVSWSLQGNQLILTHHQEQAHLELALPASHWGSNMALVSRIVLHYTAQHGLSFTLHDIANALQSWQPIQGRMQILRGRQGITLLDDSYNANPVSMQAALNTLAAISGSRIAILGDMAELGQDAESLHLNLHTDKVETLILVGKHMRTVHQQRTDSLWFADTESLLQQLPKLSNLWTQNTHVLVKASRSMQLDKVVAQLTSQEIHNAV